MVTKKSDAELVQACRTGEVEAFEEILSRFGSKVYNLAVRIVKSAEDAEEVMQDVFVTVHTKLESFAERSAFSSWLYRVTSNAAFMKLRARNRRKALSLEDLDPAERQDWASDRSEAADVDFISVRHELRASIEAAIEALPEDYRAIFILRDVDGLSNEAVGQLLNLSVPAVKSRLHRSRLFLRKRLEQYRCNEDEINVDPQLAIVQ